MTVGERIIELLRQRSCPFELLVHEPASTAAEAAAARGTALEEGTKAILFKVDDAFGIFALSAERAIRSARIREALGVRRTRFASVAELADLTGLERGAVPPFGRPVLPFPLFADPSVFARPDLVFTAGSRTRSIRMSSELYREVALPTVLPFAR